MSEITKPVILDETGRQVHPRLDSINEQIQASTLAFVEAVDRIIEAMDRLDIIYYVEQEGQVTELVTDH